MMHREVHDMLFLHGFYELHHTDLYVLVLDDLLQIPLHQANKVSVDLYATDVFINIRQ